MKREDERYAQLIEELKGKLPILREPDILTEEIIHRISSLPVKRRTSPYVAIISGISGVAATLLLCLLVSQSMVTPLPVRDTRIAIPYKALIHLPEEMSLSQKKTLLLARWQTQQQEQAARREFLIKRANEMKCKLK
ncbi:hypothetical protein [Bacteroides sp.]|uniref:hypothetical protein n=1 Tax=Bacteroides sp. TaxID=29523 RepID=UPI002FCA3A3B